MLWLNVYKIYVGFNKKRSNKYPINTICDQINEKYNNLCSHIKILEFKYKKKNPMLFSILSFYKKQITNIILIK